MAFPLPVINSLAEEYAYLDQWYGLSRWTLVRRELVYWQGRTIDLLEIVVQPRFYGAAPARFRVPFDATKIRPAGQAEDIPQSHSASFAVPFLLLLMGVGVVWLLKSNK